MMLVDTHSHIDYLVREGADATVVMDEAKMAGVSWMVNPSVTPDHFSDVLRLIEQFPNLFAASAVHPTDVQDVDPETWKTSVETMLEHPKVVAIGETGLDYHWDKTHIELQHSFFRTLLSMARERNLPVIVHDREAHEDICRIISEFSGVRGVMHCFSGDTDFANAMIKLGFYISFAGNVTFKNAKNLHEAATEVPLEWMLLETDAPFLSPVPFRGKPNDPAKVQYVAARIAELKGIPIETVAEVTSENARKVFNPCLS